MRSIISLLAALICLAGLAQSPADAFVRIENCQLVDDSGPVKVMGVNWVDGFWKFARDGNRDAYLPAMDALRDAHVPFFRMALGPWAKYKAGAAPAPAIADFVENRDRYFQRLDIFLSDARAHGLGVVLDVFWNIDPYTIYFGEQPRASTESDSRTFAFLRSTVQELGRRVGSDQNIWMIEFLNEGNLNIDFAKARHDRADLDALLAELAGALRQAGDHHVLTTGNSLPRPAAFHFNRGEGSAPDSPDQFVSALNGETPAGIDVASVHIYPERKQQRPWVGDNILGVLGPLLENSRKTCKPLFVGEFGAKNPKEDIPMIKSIRDSGVPLSAVWGFGRFNRDPNAFGMDDAGREILRSVGKGATQ